MDIAENLARVRERIARAAEKAGRDPGEVTLVAVTKTVDLERIREAVEAGVRDLGENYAQEAREKMDRFGPEVRWHFIGHLQTNKVKKAIEIFDMIETVDSLDLAREIDKRAGAAGKAMPILIEINSGEEDQKAGVRPVDAEPLIRAAAALPHVKIEGLMTMGPFEGDPEDSRPYFRETKALFETIKTLGIPGVEMKRLSMGMTNSYKVAIEEGATMVRLGTLIFGPR